jgi:tripartite-type tricarboxylate transporter receptor subunit TctC
VNHRAHTNHLKSVACLLAAAALLAVQGPAAAQAPAYPNKPLRFFVSFPPGGPADLAVRIMIPRLAERLGQQVVPDNRGGAGGAIGADLVAKSAPDGYSIGMGSSGALTVNVVLQPNLPYNPVKDLAPVSMAIKIPLILVAHPSFPAASVRELIAQIRAKPGQLSFGSGGGTGGGMHLAGVSLGKAAGLELVHVPYKGSAPAAVDLMGGQIPLAIIDMASTRTFIKAGKLKALGTLGAARSPLSPDIPTLAESGLPGFAAESWMGVIAPAQTPAEIVARLNGHFVAVLSHPDTREKLLAAGFEPSPSSPGELGEVIRSEIARWSKLVKEANIVIDEK